jgi:Uncharacterized protein conserved in bacteria
MTLGKRFGAALIAAVLGAGAMSVPATPVQAQGLLDALFKGPEQRRREREARLKAEAAAAAAAQEATKPAAAPVVRISGPTYKTYRADTFVAVDFSKLADPVITGATVAGGLSPLGIDPFAEGRPALSELRLRALPQVAEAVIAHYSSKPAYLWVSNGNVSARARSVLAVLADADAVGLSAADYRVDLPSDSYDLSQATARQREMMRFEMALSVAVASYALDAARGRIDPNRISGYHDFKRKAPELAPALEAIASAADPGAALYGYNPKGAHFAALVDELKRLKAEDAGNHVVVASDLLLKPGQSNPELANVIAALQLKASDKIKTDHALIFASYAGKPVYDEEIVALVKDFQKESGLSADGVIGPATVRALVGETNASRIEKVLVALEQARWLPGELASRRVFINQPAFTATYYNDGKPELTTRTVIGSKANQTYFFDDEIETVEFNPYWGVPQSILINEMLPKLRNDPSYLDRLGYEVVSNGKAVSSTAINWHAVGKNNSIGVRQPPSGDNALGELKILFPNSHAIYMHDTPSKSLFERDMRAFSHGCVRLQDPRGMAAKVLGISVEEVGQQIAQGRNKAVPTPQKIPVHVAYFTAWPNDDGKVEYFADVYGRDAYVRKAIEATAAARASTS